MADNLPVYNKNNGRYRREVWELIYKERCFYCGRPTPINQRTRDHIIPQCKGGRSIMGNMVMACRMCNKKKNDKDVFDFIDNNIKMSRRVTLKLTIYEMLRKINK